jgi:manganese/zinc/iron transport system substrate-binding protein
LFFYFTSKKKTSKNKPLIVCSTSIIYDTVKNLIFNEADVISIMGPGIDPHLYKASSNDAYNIENADIIFYNGLHLEGKMADIFESIKKKNKKIYAVSETIDDYLLLGTDYEGIYDPHIWHDVWLWKKVTKYIGEILIKSYPEKSILIERNLEIYLEKLDELDFFVKNKISEIKYNKILITSHDAFSYFSKRYGIECYSVQGISTDAEASINDTEKILKILIENDVPTIFVEQTVCENYLKNIQSIMELQGKKINIGKKLYSDALGEKSGSSYIQMITENVLEITAGLNNYET